MVELFVVEYMTALGMTMVLLFLDSRYSKKRTILTVYGVTALIMAVVAAIYLKFDFQATLHIYSLVVHIPSLLLLLLLSRHRGWQVVFQMLSAILFCSLTQQGARLIFYMSDNKIWVLILSYVVLSAVIIWFLIRFLRPLLLQTLLELRRGWWLICVVMATYYIIIIYLIPDYSWNTWSSIVLKPVISLLMAGVYCIMMFFFISIRNEAEARHNVQLSIFQLSALQSRMEAVQAVENAIRTERHDLRHRIQTVIELVARGDREAALDFLDAAQKRLDMHKAIRWCRPPVLDAVFSSYFDQAENQGIRVDAKIFLTDSLPVDEGELAIVLSNALENAIHANLALPSDQREIHCKMVGTPSIMLEISNPCTGNISFDINGLPMAQRAGHGLGVQSISAFCRKNGAVCQFDLTDGWFRLRLVL